MVDSDLLGIDSSCYCCIILIYGYWTEMGLNGAISTLKIYMVDFYSSYCCIVMIDVM